MFNPMKTFLTLLCSTLLWLGAASPLPAAQTDVMVVYDASNSMWGLIDGRHKVEIAREVMAGVMEEWPDEIRVGLVVYGHRRPGDCEDIETVLPVGPLDRQEFSGIVNDIMPRGKTPIAASLQHAAKEIGYEDRPATIILISDGIETCGGDPDAVSNELARAGINFTAHVIGFDVTAEADQESLKRIADNTGGRFFTAANAAELQSALQETVRQVAQQTPEPTPEPTPIPVPDITLLTPDSAVVGSEFTVSWEGEAEVRDVIGLVTPDSSDDDRGVHARIGDADTEVVLMAPGDPGDYLIRYHHLASGEIAATSPIVLMEAGPELVAPEEVMAGSEIEVSWSGAIHPRDFILIVPADASDDTSAPRNYYFRVGDKQSDTLLAPGEPGDYEIRYRLIAGDRIMARTKVGLTEAEVELQAPDRASAGATVEVSWGNPIHPRDAIAIVPAGADPDDYGDYKRVGDRTGMQLNTPDEPGNYEIRYLLNVLGEQIAARKIIIE